VIKEKKKKKETRRGDETEGKKIISR